MRKMIATGMPKVIQNHSKSMAWATLGRFVIQILAESIADVIFETKNATCWQKGPPNGFLNQ
jgi:hypothetical protein